MAHNAATMKIGFVGLGAMGRGMARNIAKAGFPLTVFDVSEQARCTFNDVCSVAASVEDVFDACDVLMLSLPASPDVETVVASLIIAGARDKIVIDLSTSIPSSTIQLNERLTAAGAAMLDAPLGGGPAQAADGKLTVMVGGDRTVYERCLPIFQSLAAKIFHVGTSGSAHTIKLAANYLSIVYVAAYAEIIPLLQKLGVDAETFFDVVGASGGNSPIFQLVAPKIIHDKYDMAFRMGLAIKDLGYINQMFDQAQAPGDVLHAAQRLFDQARHMGLAEEDTSAVAKVVKKALGLTCESAGET